MVQKAKIVQILLQDMSKETVDPIKFSKKGFLIILFMMFIVFVGEYTHGN